MEVRVVEGGQLHLAGEVVQPHLDDLVDLRLKPALGPPGRCRHARADRRRNRDQDQRRQRGAYPLRSGPGGEQRLQYPVVANRAYPPNTPEARLSEIVAAVSRLLADQPRLTACLISAGNRRATSLNLTVASRWS
jgi:hypothetical protein